MTDPLLDDIPETLARLRSGAATARALTEAALARIAAHNDGIGAITGLTAETALAEADRADRARAGGGDPGPLGGLPVAVKDIIDTVPAVCSAGLPGLARYRPAADAEAVRRLRAAGAVIVGVTATDPGAFGVRTDAVRHPHAPGRSVGGSSGGSGAAVAAGFAFAALGTDTGGSVRIPSACCQTATLKPTRGRVPTAGVRPLAWSLDHVGPMTRRVRDLAPVAAVLDPGFAATVAPEREPVRVGFDPHCYAEADAAVLAGVAAGLEAAAALGAELVEVALPGPAEVIDIHRVVFLCEAAAYYAESGLGDDPTLPELPRACLAAATGVSGADYVRAMRGRDQLKRRLAAVFADVDIVIAPTLPVPTPLSTDRVVTVAGVEHDYTLGLVRYTALFNHTGNPVVAMPATVAGPGLGASIQVVAAPDRDAFAVAFAERLEARLGLALDRAVAG